jgi:hypothetical protein
MEHKETDIMKRKKAKTAYRQEQIEAIFSLPCIILWSDGNQSETTLGQAFTTEDDYIRYQSYKRNGKAYPLRIEAVEPKDPTEPSRIFPTGNTKADVYELLKNLCQYFTKSLEIFLAEGAKKV